MKNLLLLSVCALLFGCTSIELSENDFLRPDQKPPAPQTLGDGCAMENVSVAHTDGAVSRDIHVRCPRSIATVLYFGGNEFRIDREGGPVVQALAKAGSDVVIFDYRGYGRSDGAPTADLLRRDAVDVYRFVRAKAANHVVVHGLSLGSFVAASVAQTQPVDGLVLEGVPTNAGDMVRAQIPSYASPFVRTKLTAGLLAIDNVQALRGYDGPLLILAGGKDEQVPVSLQRSLYEQAATPRKEFHVFPAYGHKGLIESAEFPPMLRQFLSGPVDSFAKGKVSGTSLRT